MGERIHMGVQEFTQRRWRCVHCRKSWARKRAATEHVERGCHKNPATMTCATCRHFCPGCGSTWEEPGSDPYCRVGVHPLESLERFEYPKGCSAWVDVIGGSDQDGC